MFAALNDLDICTCDFGNAYLNEPTREKVHVVVGKELIGTQREGKNDVIVRSLYGLTSVDAA